MAAEFGSWQNVTEFTEDTVLTADSVESNPVFDCFALGTYQLQEAQNDSDINETCAEKNENGPRQETAARRIGSLSLYSVREVENKVSAIKRKQRVDKDGILDMKWSNSGESLILGCSNGCVSVHRFDGEARTIDMEASASVCVDSSKICMSIDWVNQGLDSNEKRVVSCFSTGTIAVTDLHSLKVASEWTGHDYDAWVVAHDRWSSDTVYSGGDDCRFKTWDLRDLARPVHVNKAHSMGVCSIQGNKHKEFIVASGSYDESIYIWDTRYKTKPLCHIETGGGVWRLKWHPYNPELLLAACMHDGFKIYGISDMSSGCLLNAYNEHQSLAYGADWFIPSWNSKPEKLENSIIATCSFYDHKLCVWRLEGSDKN